MILFLQLLTFILTPEHCDPTLSIEFVDGVDTNLADIGGDNVVGDENPIEFAGGGI